jgi:hypothetical protein
MKLQGNNMFPEGVVPPSPTPGEGEETVPEEDEKDINDLD